MLFEYTGGYAIVREGRHKKTGEKFAVKIINLVSSVPKTNEPLEVGKKPATVEEDEDSGEPEELTHIETMNEILLQQSIEHSNIVRIHEFFINRGIFRVIHAHSTEYTSQFISDSMSFIKCFRPMLYCHGSYERT